MENIDLAFFCKKIHINDFVGSLNCRLISSSFCSCTLLHYVPVLNFHPEWTSRGEQFWTAQLSDRSQEPSDPFIQKFLRLQKASNFLAVHMNSSQLLSTIKHKTFLHLHKKPEMQSLLHYALRKEQSNHWYPRSLQLYDGGKWQSLRKQIVLWAQGKAKTKSGSLSFTC